MINGSFFIISIVWILYGIAGRSGIMLVPKKCRGYVWTEDWKHCMGTAYLLLGVPWLLFGLACRALSLDLGWGESCVILLVLASPSFIYGCVIDRKYKRLRDKD